MMELITYLSKIGNGWISIYLQPMLLWTLLVAVFLCLKPFWKSLHVEYRYHLRLAVLCALPVGLVAAWVVHNWNSWFRESTTPASWMSLPMPSVMESVPSIAGNSSASGIPGAELLQALIPVLAVIGSVWMVVRTIRQLIHLDRLRSHTTATSIDELDGLTKTNRHLVREIGQPIDIVFLEMQSVPVTFGLRKPAIFLPESLRANPEKLNLALLHELIHIRNHDYRTHLGLTLLRCVFWFHPFVHLLVRQTVEDREFRCDYQVLERTASRKAYARLLFDMIPAQRRSANLSVSMAQETSNLTQRIQMMINQQPLKNIPTKRSMLLTAAVFMTSVLVMACTDFSPQDDAEIPEEVAAEGGEVVTSQSEEDESSTREILKVADEMPKLIGGLSGLQEELRFPASAYEAGFEGRAYVNFIVDEQGRVENPRVIRIGEAEFFEELGDEADRIRQELEQEILRTINTAEFEPARNQGEVVPMEYNVGFRLKK